MEIKGKTIGTGKPLLCVPVMESNKEEIIDELRTLAKSEADVVEWRIDVFADYKNYNAVREVFAAAAECMKEKIFLYTFRTKKQVITFTRTVHVVAASEDKEPVYVARELVLTQGEEDYDLTDEIVWK